MRAIVKKLLKLFSRAILRKYQPDVIGVTGSIGKTNVKDVAVKILSAKFRVLGNPNFHSNQYGLPLAIIGAITPCHSWWGWLKVFGRASRLLLKRDKNYPEVLVLEMLASRPGDLPYLTSIAPCKIAVVTSLHDAYLDYFKTLKKLSQELRFMVSHLDKNSFAILNHDEEEVWVMNKKTDADVLSYGFSSEAEVRASDILEKTTEDGGVGGLFFKVSYGGAVAPMYISNIKKKSDIYPYLAAIAIALTMGLHLVEISEVLKEV